MTATANLDTLALWFRDGCRPRCFSYCVGQREQVVLGRLQRGSVKCESDDFPPTRCTQPLGVLLA